MRIVSLNSWHGKLKDPLRAYLSKIAETTDIFCFQETDPETRQLISSILTGFNVIAADYGQRQPDCFHQAIYFRASRIALGSHNVFLPGSATSGMAIHSEFTDRGATFALCNVHGISYHGVDTKLDTPDRVAQNNAVIDFYRGSKIPVIITGDFNMLPEADSIKAFGRAGYANLILDYHIKTTRNHYIWDRYPNGRQYYADFMFLSPGLVPRDFTVPEDLISDHQPMVLDLAVPSPAAIK